MRAIWYLSTWGDKIDADAVAAQIAAGELVKHHTAAAAGYISRRPGTKLAYTYAGRFGRGVVICSPRFDTTQFFNITYYIEREDKQK